MSLEFNSHTNSVYFIELLESVHRLFIMRCASLVFGPFLMKIGFVHSLFLRLKCVVCNWIWSLFTKLSMALLQVVSNLASGTPLSRPKVIPVRKPSFVQILICTSFILSRAASLSGTPYLLRSSLLQMPVFSIRLSKTGSLNKYLRGIGPGANPALLLW